MALFVAHYARPHTEILTVPYPAVSFPYPVYKPLPPAFRVPKLSTSVDPVAAEHDWHGDYRDPDHASKVSRR
jgi:hypothetical protein